MKEAGTKKEGLKRLLKFRAWDGEKMIEDVLPFRWDFVLTNMLSMCIESTGQGILGSGGKTATFEIPGYAYKEIMQYTGLKDKNGKEIWESDIVHFVGGTTSALPCGNYAHDVHRIGAKLKIVWLKSGWTLQPLSFDKDIPNMVGNVNNYDFWNYAGSLEVIGNIHQNPNQP